MTGPAPRYFLVGNVSVPVAAEGPMVQGLKDLGFRLPERDPGADGALPHEAGEQLDGEQVDGEDPLELQETGSGATGRRTTSCSSTR